MASLLARTFFLVAFGLTLVAAQDGTECSPVSFSSDSFVCACDESYCDFIGEVSTPDEGNYRRVISSRDSFRFGIVDGVDDLTSSGDTLIVINHEYEYQSMLGFGGAFTDSTGINVVSLSETLQNQLLRSYFSPSGIEYNIGRIPIAGSDFSTYAYSYDEVDGDVDLEFFALTDEDFNYKIPLIQKAIEMSNKEIRLFGSPWSPPSWMKENGMLNGTGGLLLEMRDPFAQYLIKFVQAYESYNLTIWGITPQNEPLTGFEDWAWNTCAWSAEDMRDFIKNNMGPAFTAAGLRRVQVMLLDHNRDALPWYPGASFEDAEANQYVDGVAVHWYADSDHGTEYLQETKALFPDKFLLYTEACEGWYSPDDERVVLGSWQRAENYAANIIEDVNNYVTGWVDWNMALSLTGGPNWAANYVDSPILVDPTNQVFYKQPMFYAMGHFSKFISEGSKRMYSSVEGSTNIQAAAFHTPDSGDVVVILNTGDSSETISILNHAGNYINIEMNPKSLETVLFS